MKAKLLFFYLLPFVGLSQILLGNEIIGVTSNERFGKSVAISDDGNTVVIGNIDEDSNGTNSGQVKVFHYDGISWVQQGQSINGSASAFSSYSGWSTSISGDGNIIAIGTPYYNKPGVGFVGQVRIYQYNGVNWVQLGSDIEGIDATYILGYSISLSTDGSKIAIGAPNNSSDGLSGYIKILQYNGVSWEQIGLDINGDFVDKFNDIYAGLFGYSVSLSNDGNTLVTGNPYYTDYNNGTVTKNGGRVQVYFFNGLNWIQKGQNIDSQYFYNSLGHAVSISDDGNTIAVGNPFNNNNNGNGFDSGDVSVYQYNGLNWIQKGQIINGTTNQEGLGFCISMSGDGNIIAFGSPSSLNSEQSFIYQYINSSWVKKSIGFNGIYATSISLSNNGNRVAIGYEYGGIDYSGSVNVYDLTAVLSTKSLDVDYFSFYPNPVKEELYIIINQGLELKQVNIYNTLSQYMYSVKSSRIDIRDLTSGVYFVEVETNQGKSAKKIIVE